MPKDYHEFLPALTEIEEKPLNPLGTIIFWIIMLFITFTFIFMYFGKVDVVVTASGLVIPDGEEKVIQTLEKGVLTSLFVKEGDYVSKGETVAVVQPAEYEPGLELAALNEEENEIKAQIASNSANLKVLKSREARLKKVSDIIPKAQSEDISREISAMNFENSRLNSRLNSVEIRRRQLNRQRQELKSPVNGYIGQVFIHTEGGTLLPAEKIVSIIPKDAKLKVKAKVLNRDIGFVKPKMPVIVKFETFNFQKYGTVPGKVDVISPNSLKDEHLGNIYEIFITLDETSLNVEGQKEPVKAGMSALCEIKIGKRRIIEFFIYPLIKYLDESIKVL